MLFGDSRVNNRAGKFVSLERAEDSLTCSEGWERGLLIGIWGSVSFLGKPVAK